jgi:hypothetical protein
MTKVNKKEEKVIVKSEEDWMTKKWRPMMAIMYMTCCLFDFVLFPIMFTAVQFWETAIANDAFRQWAPITLQGGGLFHVAMGAVLGVTAYGRTQEKVAGASNISTGVSTGSYNNDTSNFGSPQTQSFGSSQSFNTTETTTEFSMSPAPTSAPGGRRPVTPNFNV